MARFKDDLLKWEDIHTSIMEYHDGLVVSLFLTAEDCRNARFAVKGALKSIEDIPAVDAVEVVRCRECKHFAEFSEAAKEDGFGGTCRKLIMKVVGNSFSQVKETDFCSYAERK